VDDWDWARKQLAKRGPGELLVHAVPCKDGEGGKGWLAVSDQRIWYFQKGLIAASEEYDFGCTTSFQEIPFSFGRNVMLVVDGQPYTMPSTAAEEFVAAVERQRRTAAGD
jgi:hypothetical protein